MIVVSIASADRAQRLAEQRRHVELGSPSVRHGVVILGKESLDIAGVECIAHVKDTPVNLSRARNLAGDWAATQASTGGEAIVFLDVDCLPAEQLQGWYLEALSQYPNSVLSGPVTYLPEDAPTEPERLHELRNPHPARPDLEPGEVRQATHGEYDLFWSLNFCVSAQFWRTLRDHGIGFDEQFTGYGGEDTDFAWSLRAMDVSLCWVGGADAFHMWHSVSSPPWEHLEDIVTNANRFHDKWGQWPMRGWLDEFAAAGAIRCEHNVWVVVS